MNERIFYTFSYFYDRAADLNLIGMYIFNISHTGSGNDEYDAK